VASYFHTSFVSIYIPVIATVIGIYGLIVLLMNPLILEVSDDGIKIESFPYFAIRSKIVKWNSIATFELVERYYEGSVYKLNVFKKGINRPISINIGVLDSSPQEIFEHFRSVASKNGVCEFKKEKQ